MVDLLDLRSYLKSRQFATHPLLDHLKSRLYWISDTQCISIAMQNKCTKMRFHFQMITRDMFEDALKDLSDDGVISLTGRTTIRINH